MPRVVEKRAEEDLLRNQFRSEYDFIYYIGLPAAIYKSNKIIDTNKSFKRLISLEDYAKIAEDIKLGQAYSEMQAINENIAFDINVNNKVLHCNLSPISFDPESALIIFEDNSANSQSEKNNALLYRLTLLLASSQETIERKMQLVVDQILFEIPSFDCSIMLFSHLDGLLHPVAWGSIDLESSAISGRTKFSLGRGIAGQAALHKRPIVVPNVAADERFINPPKNPQPLALVSVPMVNSHQLEGVLNITRPAGEQFTDADVQLFVTIASRLATQVESDRTKQNELKQNKIIQETAHLSFEEESFFPVRELITDLLSSDICILYYTSELLANPFLSCRGSRLTKAEAREIELFAQDICGHVKAKKLQWLVSKDFEKELAKHPRLMKKLKNGVLFPLINQGNCFGFIYVQNTQWDKVYSEYECALGASTAAQLSLSIENLLSHEEVKNEQKKLQQVQDTVRDGLILYTADRKIAMYNESARELLGFKRDLTGMDWADVLYKNPERYCRYQLTRHFNPEDYLAKARDKGITSMGLATLNSTPPKTIEIVVAPVYDLQNQFSGILSHFKDITPMHDLQTRLADRVKQMTYLFRISSIAGYDVAQIVHKTLALVLRIMDVEATQLILIEEGSEKSYYRETAGDKNLISSINLSLEKRLKVLHSSQRVQLMNLRAKQYGLVSVLSVPIMDDQKSYMGSLLVVDKKAERRFTKEDGHLLSIIAARIASKIDNAWLLNQIEQDREKLAAIIEQSVDGIFVTDAEQKIEIWNSALERLTGLDSDEAIGHTVTDARVYFTEMESNVRPDFTEIRLRHRRTNQIVWLGAAYAPITSNGEVTGYICILRDISRQKELEQAKNDFVSTASHELRSPITAIVGYLSMLKRGDAGKIINNQQAFFIDKAYNNARRMVSLIEDLLTTTRMETGQTRFHHEPVDIVHQIETILADQSFKAEEKRISITLDRTNGKLVLADPNGLHQVLVNLISNAIKYTPSKGKVSIQFASETIEGEERLITSVADTGVGIDESDQPKVFEKFTRIDNPLSVSAGGTGLGLYITKTIIEQLGGKIWIQSKKGEGSTFSISLPIANQVKKERK